MAGERAAIFTYAQLLSRIVIYKHDSSETSRDSMDLQAHKNYLIFMVYEI